MDQVQVLDSSRLWGECSLVVTDHAGISAIHAQYLNDEKVTDVISFAYPPLPAGERAYAGEIFVNAERALEYGVRYRGAAMELALYIAHGCHHLTGADDATPEERADMRRIENQWLRKARNAGLIPDDLIMPLRSRK